MRHLVWFRNDLRTLDQAALSAACQNPQAEVIALYLLNPEAIQKHDTATVRTDFDLRTIHVLQQTLQQLAIPLLIRNVPNDQEIPNFLTGLCQSLDVQCVFLNREHGPNEQLRDQKVREQLMKQAISCRIYEDACLISPGQVIRKNGQDYQVFSPFKKLWRTLLPTHNPLAAPTARTPVSITSDPLPEWDKSNFSEARQLWPAGEMAAQLRLAEFCTESLSCYAQLRNIPSQPATSRLSPYLANGSISVRMALQQVRHQKNSPSVDTWVDELAWRDFFKHILTSNPQLGKHRAYQTHTEALVWNTDQSLFQCWCNGATGFPIVDAAMRQLLTTGWMHNRLRMISAMFLVKDLWVNWRWGERWFMQHLIDGDLAANNGNWQWCASTGVDAVPYFRIFNPWVQSQRFDPDGIFIRTWIPQLKTCSTHLFHHPPRQGSIHPDYPKPIVDHEQARLHALAAFKSLKK